MVLHRMRLETVRKTRQSTNNCMMLLHVAVTLVLASLSTRHGYATASRRLRST